MLLSLLELLLTPFSQGFHRRTETSLDSVPSLTADDQPREAPTLPKKLPTAAEVIRDPALAPLGIAALAIQAARQGKVDEAITLLLGVQALDWVIAQATMIQVVRVQLERLPKPAAAQDMGTTEDARYRALEDVVQQVWGYVAPAYSDPLWEAIARAFWEGGAWTAGLTYLREASTGCQVKLLAQWVEAALASARRMAPGDALPLLWNVEAVLRDNMPAGPTRTRLWQELVKGYQAKGRNDDAERVEATLHTF